MGKHSPAPWYWTENSNWQEGSGKWLASQTGMVLDYSGCGTHECDVTKEDARLIAAAPELLEDLQAIISMIDHGSEDQSKVLAKARATISKVKGK